MASISMSRRTIALVASVVLAAVGAVALLSYINGLEDEAFEGVETDFVYQAKQLIPALTPGDQVINQGLLERSRIAKKFIAPTAITTLDQIKGRVAAVDIFPNEQIIAERFVARAEATGRLPIPAGRQGVSVEVALPPGVGGFIKPDDRVSMIAHLDVPGRGDEIEKRAEFLLQNIQVLAVGQRTIQAAARTSQTADEERTQTRNRVMLTLALTPSQAEQAVYAILNGDIYFTLLPPGATPARTRGRTERNIF